MKKSTSKKLFVRVPDAPFDNISFHSIGNVEKWKYVSQRRISLERELGAGALECKEIMELISFADLC